MWPAEDLTSLLLTASSITMFPPTPKTTFTEWAAQPGLAGECTVLCHAAVTCSYAYHALSADSATSQSPMLCWYLLYIIKYMHMPDQGTNLQPCHCLLLSICHPAAAEFIAKVGHPLCTSTYCACFSCFHLQALCHCLYIVQRGCTDERQNPYNSPCHFNAGLGDP